MQQPVGRSLLSSAHPDLPLRIVGLLTRSVGLELWNSQQFWAVGILRPVVAATAGIWHSLMLAVLSGPPDGSIGRA